MFRVCEAGCFQDAKVELIGGRLVEMTETPPHMNCVLNVETALNGALSTSRFFVAREVSVRFPKWTPLPDVAVHRGPRRPTYEDRLPTAADTAHCGSLGVNLPEGSHGEARAIRQGRDPGLLDRSSRCARRVEVYSQPAGRRYLKREDYEESGRFRW